ncbi:hypothetical protein ACLB2K_008548 [Fragaria x ananassa]
MPSACNGPWTEALSISDVGIGLNEFHVLSHPKTLFAVTRYCPLWARRTSRFRQLRSNFPVGHPSWDCSSINMLNLGVPIPSEAAEPPKGLALDWRWACTYTAHNPSPLADVGYYNPPPLGVRRPRRHTRATRQSGSDTIVTSQDPFRRNTIMSFLLLLLLFSLSRAFCFFIEAFRRTLGDHVLKLQQRLAHAFSEAPQHRPNMVPEEGLIDMSKWRKIDSRVYGITRAMIPDSSYHVLRILRGEGDYVVNIWYIVYASFVPTVCSCW